MRTDSGTISLSASVIIKSANKLCIELYFPFRNTTRTRGISYLISEQLMILTTIMRSTRSSTALQTASRATASSKPKTARKRSSKPDTTSEQSTPRKRVKSEPKEEDTKHDSTSTITTPSNSEDQTPKSKPTLGETKYKNWSKTSNASPYPSFTHPTEAECRRSHRLLDAMHGATVRKNFEYTENPGMHYPYAMDALIVATLSQATSWSNAQRAMKSMTSVYGSPFAYQKILDGGEQVLVDALRPGGMQNRKAKMVMQILHDVKKRHGKWDLNHLFNTSDDDAVKELLTYKGVGPKSAFCILSICLQRNSFAVDTHIYRIAGLWGWRPKEASREKAQAHLDARVPGDIKFALHYLLIVHGRECGRCRGNGDKMARCEYAERLAEEESDGGEGLKIEDEL